MSSVLLFQLSAENKSNEGENIMTKQIYRNVYEAAMYEEANKWLAMDWTEEWKLLDEVKETEPVVNVYYNNEEEKEDLQDLANCPF